MTYDEALQAALPENLRGKVVAVDVVRNVLNITVANSRELQDLAFLKNKLLKAIAPSFPSERILDIRFRVGDVKNPQAAPDHADKKTAYQKKLLDPRWQKMRLKILERDGWACVICGNEEITLHVHHRWYENDKEPWEIHENGLATLCEECHESESIDRRKWESQLLDALRVSYFAGDVRQWAMLVLEMPLVHLTEVQLSALRWLLKDEQRVLGVMDQYFASLRDAGGEKKPT